MNYTHRPAVSIYSNLKGLESYSPILISIIFLTEANSTESIVPASPLIALTAIHLKRLMCLNIGYSLSETLCIVCKLSSFLLEFFFSWLKQKASLFYKQMGEHYSPCPIYFRQSSLSPPNRHMQEGPEIHSLNFLCNLMTSVNIDYLWQSN